MKAAEIREMTVAEITAKLEELRKEYLNLRFSKATQHLENTAKIRSVRRDIARLHTIVKEKEKRA